MLCYVLGHWEDRQTEGAIIGAAREGSLMYHGSRLGLSDKWSPGYFVVKYVLSSSEKETGSQGLGSWSQEARGDSSFYRVWEAAVAAVAICIVRA